MDNLKDPYKTIIHMREIQGMPYKDISEKLGRNLSTVKSQIRGARKILIQRTEKDFKLVDQGIYNI
jgi:DNA-directed RNA polymerase specialized sigma24 family protein